MVSSNDPVESFFNSIRVVKDAFSPLESGLRKAAKDFEHCWQGLKIGANNGLDVASAQLNGDSATNGNKVQTYSVSNNSYHCVVSDERKKRLSINVPIKTFLGNFSHNCGSNFPERDKMEKGLKVDAKNADGTCSNCLQFVVTWSLLLNSFAQAFRSPLKTGKMQFQKMVDRDNIFGYFNTHVSKPKASGKLKKKELGQFVATCQNEDLEHKEGKNLSIECFIGLLWDQVAQNLHKIELAANHIKAVTSVLEVQAAGINEVLGNLKFSRVRGISSSIGVTFVKEENEESVTAGSKEQKQTNGFLSIPLSNVEHLRSTLASVSLTELTALVPQLGHKDYPDKKELFWVQDFFRYTESEGRRFFEELDSDGDGRVTMEDVEVALQRRKLPQGYAHEFMIALEDTYFQRPTILRAYTTLSLSKSGTLQKSEILASLKDAGLPANEHNALTMSRFLNTDSEESISYGHFRNIMLLLPSNQLKEDARSIWFQAATVVPVARPVGLPTSSLFKSALAGGLSCAFSCAIMHPVDTVKTQVQASSLSFLEIMSKVPQIGVRGLYKGSIPAILGQFSSHGLRTGISEACKLALINIMPTLPEIQVLSSFSGTYLGTVARIPCEVLKQRLQAGIFNNVAEAIVGVWNQDGLKGFFRGTGVTLLREVPFYVAGTGLYTESKKVVQSLLGRDLEPWETVVVGALSGGLTAVCTTPFDVIKTRMMTAPGGQSLSMSMAALSILREGPLGFFKGAVPRFFWVAPLGAMNFAGYELLRNAMEGNCEQTVERLSQK
ncbi:hypothetical protein NMG60_11018606 [Bertholletia excelsa]